jgi:hypothetical protein
MVTRRQADIDSVSVTYFPAQSPDGLGRFNILTSLTADSVELLSFRERRKALIRAAQREDRVRSFSFFSAVILGGFGSLAVLTLAKMYTILVRRGL